MLALAIKTDIEQAEVLVYQNETALAHISWHAHRTLADTLHQQLFTALSNAHVTMDQVEGIVVYKGPGSFTGLRIGIAVANAMAYSYEKPIVSTSGAHWANDGILRLSSGENEQVAQPEYGALPHITQPKR